MKLNAHEQRQVAVTARCDPRSVASYLAGKAVRGVTAERIRDALTSLGHGALVSQPGDVAGVPTPEAKDGAR